MQTRAYEGWSQRVLGPKIKISSRRQLKRLGWRASRVLDRIEAVDQPRTIYPGQAHLDRA